MRCRHCRRCDWGKTVNAAERFALVSSFKIKTGLVYDEEFFAHLNKSTSKCSNIRNIDFEGVWSIKTSCSDGTIFTATAKIKAKTGQRNRYDILNYINNFGQRASGSAEFSGGSLVVDLNFKSQGFRARAFLKRQGDRLRGSTSDGCDVQGVPWGGKLVFID